MSTEAVSSVLLELRAGDTAKDPHAGILGFATLEWPTVTAHATGHGWAVEPQLLSASGKQLGTRLMVRLMYADAAKAASNMRALKSSLRRCTSSL